jgi:hypothetical protein
MNPGPPTREFGRSSKPPEDHPYAVSARTPRCRPRRKRAECRLRERDAQYAINMPEARDAFPWLQEYWSTTGPFFGRPPGGAGLIRPRGTAENWFAPLPMHDHVLEPRHGSSVEPSS